MVDIDKANPFAEAPEEWVDSASGMIFNDTDLADESVFEALKRSPEVAALMTWSQNIQMNSRSGTMFDRDVYTGPRNIFDEFRIASYAAENDDVVAGIISATEALAFNKMSLECLDEDEENIWNQIAADMDFDARLREMWRELFTVSQFYAAILWGRKDYKVTGKNPKDARARKREFRSLKVPTGISLLDPLKVVPVGNLLFGNEQLAYCAERGEAEDFDKLLAQANSSDLIVDSLISGRYEATGNEKKLLQQITGANMDNLFLMNPKNVFRHTETRPSYERFAPVRMKSVFELLDLKHQLRQMDRAFLVAGTNFIVLVTKGTDQHPAKGREISQLATQVKMSARIPIIVGDHRVSVEIITPKLDTTLEPNRHNLIDSRITSRLYQILASGNYSSGMKGDDSVKISKVIARGMESRRHMMKRSIEKNIFKATYEANSAFKGGAPKLRFHPKRIALDFDNNVAVFLQDLRDRGDISRDTLLEELDINQEQEAMRREREKKNGFDDIFTPPFVPFNGEPGTGTGAGKPPTAPKAGGPAAKKATAPKTTANPKTAGRTQGGNKGGGGANPDSKTPNASPTRPRKGDNG